MMLGRDGALSILHLQVPYLLNPTFRVSISFSLFCFSFYYMRKEKKMTDFEVTVAILS